VVSQATKKKCGGAQNFRRGSPLGM
jgi:hypothetical protein